MGKEDDTFTNCMDCINLSKVKESLGDDEGIIYGFVKVGGFHKIFACKYEAEEMLPNKIKLIFDDIGTIMETSIIEDQEGK